MLITVARYEADHPRHPVLDHGPCYGLADDYLPVGAVPPERVERFPRTCGGCHRANLPMKLASARDYVLVRT
jgi:hypothetical protein